MPNQQLYANHLFFVKRITINGSLVIRWRSLVFEWKFDINYSRGSLVFPVSGASWHLNEFISIVLFINYFEYFMLFVWSRLLCLKARWMCHVGSNKLGRSIHLSHFDVNSKLRWWIQCHCHYYVAGGSLISFAHFREGLSGQLLHRIERERHLQATIRSVEHTYWWWQ